MLLHSTQHQLWHVFLFVQANICVMKLYFRAQWLNIRVSEYLICIYRVCITAWISKKNLSAEQYF